MDQQHVPVIVLVDKDTAGERSEIRQWFEDSRFSTCEASNVFEALEHLSDFTLKRRPDVVLVDVDCCEDELPIMQNVSDLPVMALSGKSRSMSSGNYYAASFDSVISKLNKLIPQ
jgi:CheY-like chemotaxis protein